MPRTSHKAPSGAGRERLIETARRLFTRRGAANVGINDVTAEAGVARMTLYNNFPSKDALTAAVYEEMAAGDLLALDRLPSEGLSEEERVLAVFDHLDRSSGDAEFRGCPFIHASLQAAEPAGPIYAIVRRYKQDLRERMLGLLDEKRSDRLALADQIVLLLDGAGTDAYLRGGADPFAAAKAAASTLLRAGR